MELLWSECLCPHSQEMGLWKVRDLAGGAVSLYKRSEKDSPDAAMCGPLAI